MAALEHRFPRSWMEDDQNCESCLVVTKKDYQGQLLSSSSEGGTFKSSALIKILSVPSKAQGMLGIEGVGRM